MGKEIGKVIHWYDKIGVAVVKLSAPLRKGDTIVIRRGEVEVNEIVTSLQLNHAPVEEAKSGDEVAVKLLNPAKEGAVILAAE